MATDSDERPPPHRIRGDVMPESIHRITGTPGTDDGMIGIGLVGHPYRYHVRIERGGGAPRLVELHLVPDDPTAPAEIDPAAIRAVPVRRLANAAARWISRGDGKIVIFDEETAALRPDRPVNGGRRRKLGDVHYRQVAELLHLARESGYSPREYVGARLGGTIPTVDRWIAEAKHRNFLRRDWSTAAEGDDDQ